jgi:MYXO-CTERM domain-containing protein
MDKLGPVGRLAAWMLLLVASSKPDAATSEQSPGEAVPCAWEQDAGAGATVVATGRGVRLSRAGRDGVSLGVRTRAVGRDGAERRREVVRERAEGQELVLEGADEVQERMVGGPLGVEQTFEVRRRPEGEGALVVEVGFEGLVPQAVPGATDRVLLRDGQGRMRGGYRDLHAADAEGRVLPARMQVRGEVVALRIDDAAAVYPVRVDPLVWVQTAELTASDGRRGDQLGASAALDGTTAIVGAPGHKVGASAVQGVAYVFVQDGATWTQQAELTASDGLEDDALGIAVAVSGDTAVVGAPDRKASRGAVYVFARSAASWTQQAELTAADGEAGDGFGSSVAVSDELVLVGATGHAVDGGAATGVAYVFARQGSAWPQEAELVPSDGLPRDGFGASVALGGTTALVSADCGGGEATGYDACGPGTAYVFTRGSAGWTQQAELTPPDGISTGRFGYAVALSGGTAVIGAAARGVDGSAGSGAAYVFVQDGAGWTQQAELTPAFGADLAGAGFPVAVSGGTVMIGAAGYEVGNQLDRGAAYVFVQTGTKWTQQALLTASDGATNNHFGTAVAVSGAAAMVVAPSHAVDGGPGPGEVYMFQLDACDAGACPHARDAGADGGTPHDATADSRPPHDAQAPADTGAARDATVHDAATDARGADASPDAGRGLYVGDIACGCRTAVGGETGASAAWLALGVVGLVARRRRRRAACDRDDVGVSDCDHDGDDDHDRDVAGPVR